MCNDCDKCDNTPLLILGEYERISRFCTSCKRVIPVVFMFV